MSPPAVPFPGSESPTRSYRVPTGLPFARSALKRDSIMALPPIQHLQHQFLKLGLAAKDRPSPAAVLAVPRGMPDVHESPEQLHGATKRPARLDLAGGGYPGDATDTLPPTPVRREMDTRLPWEKDSQAGRSLKGEAELRRDVAARLEVLVNRWGLATRVSLSRRDVRNVSSTSNDSLSADPAALDSDVRPLESLPLIPDLLQQTTAAIRAVQAYSCSLPPDSVAPPQQGTRMSHIDIHSDYVRASTAMGDPPVDPSPRCPDSTRPTRTPSSSSTASLAKASSEDALSTLRKAGWEMLGMLGSIEAKYRVLPTAGGGTDGEFDAVDENEQDIELPPLIESFSSEESFLPPMDAATRGRAAEYDHHVTLDDLHPQATIVQTYVELVDTILLRSRRSVVKKVRGPSVLSVCTNESDEREITRASGSKTPLGHRRKPKLNVASFSMDALDRKLQPSDDEEEEIVPSWALAGMNTLDRTFSILVAHLPDEMLTELVDPAVSAVGFLSSISDGEILCHGFNAVVRASASPFGFIPVASIHQIGERTAVEPGEKQRRVGQTFRRIENLSVWAAALKFRYLISFALDKHADPALHVGFDAKVVARHESGWEAMLEHALESWVTAVVAERY